MFFSHFFPILPYFPLSFCTLLKLAIAMNIGGRGFEYAPFAPSPPGHTSVWKTRGQIWEDYKSPREKCNLHRAVRFPHANYSSW